MMAGFSVGAAEEGFSGGVPVWLKLPPRAFLKNRHLRLYWSADSESMVWRAEWKEARVGAQEFSYDGATFQRDKPARALPATSSQWREIKVLGLEEGDRLLGALPTQLAPAEAGHGIYAQHALGDLVLFRDAAGTVQKASVEAKPANVILDRRYNRHELASASALLLEKELRIGFPNETAFLLFWHGGKRVQVAFVDLREREVVALFPPAGHIEGGGRPKLRGALRTLCSFALVDNVWAFLKNPVSSTSRTIHQGVQWAGTFFEPRLRDRGSGTAPAPTNAPGMTLAAWENWLDRHTATPRELGSIRLLINGEQFYPEFERRLAESRGDIDIHVCIFDHDDVAVRMADLLKTRSTNGNVRVVFDRLNTRGASGASPATPMAEGFVPLASMASYLREAGQVRVRPLLNPGFSCDHSKVFLIDGRYAYVGGMNFGREYRYEWHDLMAEVEGPVVDSLQRQFNKKWAQAGVWGDCGLAAESLCGDRPKSGSTNRAHWIELRRLYTKTFDRQIRRAELGAIDRARNHVFLENAYLYSNKMVVALVRARLRGVDVRVVMPGENDFAPGHSSNLVTANYLRRHGVRVYFYPGMSHVKALLVDGWVCFGSANFDVLSLRLNREVNLASSDSGFVNRFRQEVFEADFASARELNEQIAIDWRDHVSDVFLNPF